MIEKQQISHIVICWQIVVRNMTKLADICQQIGSKN